VTFVADRGRFIGTIIVAHDGEPIWEDAFGVDGATGDPITIDSEFDVASAGKMFTAVAVGHLLEGGRVNLDAPVVRYVPDVSPDVAQATIAQLLSHTSGMDAQSQHMLSGVKPGTFYYSNAGFDLLARVVQNVAGHRFEEEIQDVIFEPAGMTSTAVPEPWPVYPSGRGGEDSTAGDLLRFSQALFDDRLLKEATVRDFTAQKSEVSTGGYGYGFAIFTGEADEAPSIGHIGAAPNVVAAVEINATIGYTLVVTCSLGFEEIRPALEAYQSAIGMGYWRG
jgi:D-alanyl-D-alanine carboxypeptidase